MIQPAKRLKTVEEYYFSKKLREVSKRIAKGVPIINLGIGSPDLRPPSNAISELTLRVHDEKAHQYQSYQGLPELRQAIADFYRDQYYVGLNPNSEILPLMGSKEGIMLISLAFLNPRDEVLIPNPGYPTYESVTKLVGAKPIHYDLSEEKNWLPDIEELEKKDLTKVKLMWINYPHMPTGARATKKSFEEIVSFAIRHNILIVHDNPYSFILNDTPLSFLHVAGAKKVGLELNSLSKAFNMSGWRVGMVVGDKTYIDHVLKVKSNMDSGMFYGLQKGAIKALTSGDMWFSSLNSVYEERRQLIWQLADIFNCTYDRYSSGLFVWAKLPDNEMDSEKFIDNILDTKGIFITPGKIFGSQGEGYIRFSLCLPSEKIGEAIERLK
ncbi:MAG: aminotransferase class I/II-fold pyridoxal phosphate-dependent enzyme [Flavobacteriaceae bacterium]|nr:aminotransferase class I/II-fold pyridoxal phosphate-dependent enzyme [Flavobacteriaceae bacterium]